MIESLVTKFHNMTDREILIATCLKVEGLEARIDAHSVERDQEKASNLKTFRELFLESQEQNERLLKIESEKSSRRSFLMDIGGFFGFVSAGIVIWQKFKNIF